MAANQELKDYIIQQTKLGVSKDTIKSALVTAGWREVDISQAIAETEISPENGTPLKPTLPIQPVQPIQTTQVQPVQQQQPTQQPKPLEPIVVAKPTAEQPSPSPAKSSPVSFVTSDIFQPKGESVFQPKSVTGTDPAKPSGAKPEVISLSQQKKNGFKGGKNFYAILSLGILSIVLLGGNIHFYVKGGSVNSEIQSLTTAKGAVEGQLESVTKEKNALTEQITTLDKTIENLGNQLSIFALGEGSSTEPVAFSISGTLGGGGKSLYSLVTDKNVFLVVKNSKDAAVDAALKPLLGSSVELKGTHQPGSNQLTVTTVNGQVAQSATSTAPGQ
ncbi:MAG: hypothetical protein HY432_02575 [Candidatus Liptonbacteria bacterium]|nr:hypothetical protein [Candidatus Liptonbacteria bacterium]